MASSSHPLSERTCCLLPRAAQQGIALIEVIVFMMVIAIAAGAMLSVFAKTNRGSAELLIHRQALSVAEAMLDEVLAAPFTVCDPQDINFAAGACNSMPEVLPGGPELNETRLGSPSPPFSLPFDNVNDYHNYGCALGPGIVDRAGLPVAGLASYSLCVKVAPVGVAGTGIPAAQMALVTVTVTGPLLRGSVILQGLRARSRYAARTRPL